VNAACLAGTEERRSRSWPRPLLRPLTTFARWLTRDTHEAEDLVQEAFARALKAFQDFSREQTFVHGLFRIVRNTFLSRDRMLRPCVG